MRRRQKQAVALLATATVITLLWPGPSSADDGPQTTLGGFQASLTASPIRIQVFDMGIPGPPDPNKAQLDMGIAYSHSEGSLGRMASTSSYFWPGDLVGNGLSQLIPGANYPVRSDAAYPATAATPAANKVQVTDGNGMQTAAGPITTTASCTGLGVTGTNLLTGFLTGIGQMFGQKPAPAPVPVPDLLAGIVSLKNVTSETDVKLGKDSVTATAHAAMSAIDVLGGLISIKGFDVRSTTVSDGKKATVDGTATIGGLTVFGQTIGLNTKGLQAGGSAVPLPQLPNLFSALGLSMKWLQSDKQVTQQDAGAGGTLDALGMEITIDTTVLWNAFHIGDLMAPFAQVLAMIPSFGSILGGLVTYAPKIVIDVGSVQSSLTASPAFDFGDGGTTGGGDTGGTVPGTGGGGTSADVGTTGGGTVGTTGGGTVGTIGSGTGSGIGGESVSAGDGGGVTTGGTTTDTTDTTGGSTIPTLGTQPAALKLPALGSVPRLLILGGIALAAVLGWLLRAAALAAFGAAGSCAMGLATGVPDLRKG